MIALALGLVLLAAFLSVLQRCRAPVRHQRKPRAPAGCRAARALGAGCRYRTRRFLRLRAVIAHAPGARRRGARRRHRVAAARCAAPRRGRIAARGRPRLRHQLRASISSCPCRVPTTSSRPAAARAIARPPHRRAARAAGSDTLTRAPRLAEHGAAARGQAAGLFAPARCVRRSRMLFADGQRARPRRSETTKCATSKCAPTTSPTTPSAARAGRRCG